MGIEGKRAMPTVDRRGSSVGDGGDGEKIQNVKVMVQNRDSALQGRINTYWLAGSPKHSPSRNN